jgi:hypothetical protein
VHELHGLITTGPSTTSLRLLKLEQNLFNLYTIDHQTETPEFLKKAQEQAKKHEPIITLTEFQVLLQNYESFVSLNRQSVALGSITWRLKIAPSALKNINNDTLVLLLQLIQKNVLFFRYFKLPVIDFLKLYANQNNLNDEILCSLIVLSAISSDCIFTAPPDQKKFIRIYEKDTFVDIEMDEHRRTRLISAFDKARDVYGYSSFFRHNN